MRRWLSTLAPLLCAAGVALGAPSDGVPTADLLQPGRIAAPTPQQSVEVAQHDLGRMQGIYQNMKKLAADAQRKEDVIKLTCVQDKLDQTRGHLNVAVPAVRAVMDAAASGDSATRQFQVEKVTILTQKTEVLGTEAHNCVGEDVNYVGDTSVEEVIDPNLPSQDPTEPPLRLPAVTRPPDATPFV